jgi:hypothetical protein
MQVRLLPLRRRHYAEHKPKGTNMLSTEARHPPVGRRDEAAIRAASTRKALSFKKERDI